MKLIMLCAVQGDSKRGGEAGGGSGHEDSDLERKRREAEALLQSVGITPDIPHGKVIHIASMFVLLFPPPLNSHHFLVVYLMGLKSCL